MWLLDNTITTTLAGTIPTYPIDGIFRRTVIFYPVSRDVNDDIVSSGGTIDARTKKVVVTTTWTTGGVSNSKSLSFYIADIFN